MDLAEIRKKAGSKAKRGEKAPPPQVETRAPAAPISAALPASPKTAAPPAPVPAATFCAIPDRVAEIDRLEALFSWKPLQDLANEETYLKGLVGAAKEEEEDFRQLLAFGLGDEEYTLDIACIREIIKPREITEIPRAPEFILGIISLRGVIIPVFDLKRRLKLGAAETSPRSRIIVCQDDEREAGLLVDSITEVVQLAKRKIEPPPAVLSGIDRDLVEGVGRHQGRMMVLLHLPSVLDAELV